MLPKILIGAPTYEGKDYCLAEFASALKSLVYPNMDICYVDNSSTDWFSQKMNVMGINTIWQPSAMRLASKKLERGSNYLRQKAIDGKYFAHLQLETDMVVEPNTLLEMLNEMINEDALVVGSMYAIYGGAMRKKLAYKIKYDADLDSVLSMPEISDWTKLDRPLMNVQSCGLGCTLIRTSVYDKHKVSYRSTVQTTPDGLFFRDLTSRGIKAYMRTTDFLTHMNRGDWDASEKMIGA